MCGRTGLSLNKNNICCACSYKNKTSSNYTKVEWVEEYNDGKQYVPSYNIAPTMVTPVIVSARSFINSSDHERIIKPMMWGMIPPWQKDNYRSHNLSTNNCRIENITSSKMYYPVLRDGGRCIIVAEGFYEWQTTNPSNKTKQPYYIYTEQSEGVEVDKSETWTNDFSEQSGWSGIKLLHIAGLYNVWKNGDITIYSYTVITMDSNSTLDWLHDRMPAILETEEQINAWLDVDNVKPEKALTYLTPSKNLKWHPVSTNVNNSRYQAGDCNKPIELNKLPKSQKPLTSWFSKTNKRTLESNETENKKTKT